MLCSCHLGRGRSCLVYQGSHVLRKHFWCYHFNSLRSFPHDVLGSLACFFPRNGFFFRLAKWNTENDWPKVMLSHWGIRGSVVFDVMICLVFFESLEMWKKIGKNKQSLGKPCVLLLSCPFFLIKFCIVFLFKPCWTLIFERSSDQKPNPFQFGGFLNGIMPFFFDKNRGLPLSKAPCGQCNRPLRYWILVHCTLACWHQVGQVEAFGDFFVFRWRFLFWKWKTLKGSFRKDIPPKKWLKELWFWIWNNFSQIVCMVLQRVSFF